MNAERRSDIEDINSKLRFLSKIKKGERLRIDGLSVVENTWTAKFLRAWDTWRDSKNVEEAKEGREKTLEFIRDVYDSGFKFASSIIKDTSSYSSDLWNMLIKNLKDAQPGITNLMVYYERDTLYISKMETFMELLNAKINDLETERKAHTDYYIPEEDEIVIDEENM